MSDDSDALRLLLFLLTHHQEDLAAKRPLPVKLSSPDYLRAVKAQWPVGERRMRSALGQLIRSGAIRRTRGGGRGKSSEVTFLRPTATIVEELLASNGDALGEGERARANELLEQRRVADSSTRPVVHWWGAEQGGPNAIVVAPPSDELIGRQELPGRDDEIAQLVEALQHHSVVAIVEETGAGKTRFASRFTWLLRIGINGGLKIRWIRTEDGMTLREIAAACTRPDEPEHEGAVPPDLEGWRADPEREAADFARWLGTECNLLIVDDFDMALDRDGHPRDPALDSFLDLLIDHGRDALESSRVLLLAQAMPVSTEHQRKPRRVSLSPLSVEATSALFAARGRSISEDEARLLRDETSGNPGLLTTLAISMEDVKEVRPLPTRSAVSRIYDKLSPEARLILGVVACETRSVPERMLRTVLDDLALHAQDIADEVARLEHVTPLLQYDFTDEREYRVTGLTRKMLLDSKLDAEQIRLVRGAVLRYHLGVARDGDPRSMEHVLPAAQQAVAIDRRRAIAELLFDDGAAEQLLACGRLADAQRVVELVFAIDERTPGAAVLPEQARRLRLQEYAPQGLSVLGRALWRRGHLAQAHACLARQIELSDAPSATELVALAGVLVDLGEFDEGSRILRHAQEVASPNDAGERQAWSSIGLVFARRGPVTSAVKAYERALEACRIEDDEAGVVQNLIRLGMVRWREGKLDQAKRLYDQALPLAERLGDPYLLGMVQGDLAHTYVDRPSPSRRDLDDAESWYRKALETHRDVKRGQGYWRAGLARVAHLRGQTSKARRLLVLAVDTHREVGDTHAVPRHLWYLGGLYASSRTAVKTIAYYEAALRAFARVEGVIEGRNCEREYRRVRRSLAQSGLAIGTLGRRRDAYVAQIERYLEGDGGQLP